MSGWVTGSVKERGKERRGRGHVGQGVPSAGVEVGVPARWTFSAGVCTVHGGPLPKQIWTYVYSF